MSAQQLLAGVDEVGRGALAGAVIAAAVILDANRPLDHLADSKTINHKKRVRLAEHIKIASIAFAIGRAEVHEIDNMNILNASLLAMKRAVEALTVKPDRVYIDGQYVPDIDCSSKAIVRGDSLVPAISAASIIAKVYRDAEMDNMARMYPGYGFSSHKGYPTRQHIKSLHHLGISNIHRLSFKPIKKILQHST